MARCAAVVLILLLASACAAGSEDIVPRDIVSHIPWSVPETAHYRLLKDGDTKGSGQLRLDQAGDVLSLRQDFEIPDQEVTDRVLVEAEPLTLRPRRVQRTINGPEGERNCEAKYQGAGVTVEQRAKQEKRTDKLDAPLKSYDTWSDLFVWRTLLFSQGLEVKYADVLSCSLAKPDLLSVVLKVTKTETVTVRAGTFQAWQLEIRSGGKTQHAWYADDAARTLVRYDNGDLVFELESID